MFGILRAEVFGGFVSTIGPWMLGLCLLGEVGIGVLSLRVVWVLLVANPALCCGQSLVISIQGFECCSVLVLGFHLV